VNSCVIVDVETAPIDNAAEFIEAPTAPSNYRDTDKIAAYVEERAREQTARCSLDFNLCKIVALAWDDGTRAAHLPCLTEADEQHALTTFWSVAEGRRLLGFCARTFDLPVLIQRSRYLQIDYPPVSLARYGKGDVIDLRDVLTFDDQRYEAIMPRSLKMFARRFGIPVTDDIDGAQIPELVAKGEWNRVIAHVTSDLALTKALAVRLGYLQTLTQSEMVF
jgi:predicted PolB exonuclease-like 3'-5' exonuclease